jgi:uncharacterized protein (DUF302 family)
MATDGLTTIPSGFGPRETTDRLETEIKAKGMTVFGATDIQTIDAMATALNAVVTKATKAP